jgi:hypothetical protein
MKNPATAQSEFRLARPVISEEVIQDILDALPAIPIYVRELKRQISTLQESNEIMESRILQLEKQYVHRNCGYLNASFMVSSQAVGKREVARVLIDHLSRFVGVVVSTTYEGSIICMISNPSSLFASRRVWFIGGTHMDRSI